MPGGYFDVGGALSKPYARDSRYMHGSQNRPITQDASHSVPHSIPVPGGLYDAEDSIFKPQ